MHEYFKSASFNDCCKLDFKRPIFKQPPKKMPRPEMSSKNLSAEGHILKQKKSLQKIRSFRNIAFKVGKQENKSSIPEHKSPEFGVQNPSFKKVGPTIAQIGPQYVNIKGFRQTCFQNKRISEDKFADTRHEAYQTLNSKRREKMSDKLSKAEFQRLSPKYIMKMSTQRQGYRSSNCRFQFSDNNNVHNFPAFNATNQQKTHLKSLYLTEGKTNNPSFGLKNLGSQDSLIQSKQIRAHPVRNFNNLNLIDSSRENPRISFQSVNQSSNQPLIKPKNALGKCPNQISNKEAEEATMNPSDIFQNQIPQEIKNDLLLHIETASSFLHNNKNPNQQTSFDEKVTPDLKVHEVESSNLFKEEEWQSSIKICPQTPSSPNLASVRECTHILCANSNKVFPPHVSNNQTPGKSSYLSINDRQQSFLRQRYTPEKHLLPNWQPYGCYTPQRFNYSVQQFQALGKTAMYSPHGYPTPFAETPVNEQLNAIEFPTPCNPENDKFLYPVDEILRKSPSSRQYGCGSEQRGRVKNYRVVRKDSDNIESEMLISTVNSLKERSIYPRRTNRFKSFVSVLSEGNSSRSSERSSIVLDSQPMELVSSKPIVKLIDRQIDD